MDWLVAGNEIETDGAPWLTSAELFTGAFDARLAHERGAVQAGRGGVPGASVRAASRMPAPELRHADIVYELRYSGAVADTDPTKQYLSLYRAETTGTVFARQRCVSSAVLVVDGSALCSAKNSVSAPAVAKCVAAAGVTATAH